MFITKSLLLPKKFIITKKVYYYKKFITKSKGERKNLSEIYKKRGKNQGRNSTTKWILPSGT